MAEMSVNDCCRLCDKILRINGKIANSMLIFDRKERRGYIYDKLLNLGLDLENTPFRSCRICRECFRVIVTLQREKQIIDEWKQQEEPCQEEDESCVSSTDEPAPSETTDNQPKLTYLLFPSWSNERKQKTYGCPDCNKSFKSLVLLQRHQRLHTGENLLQCTLCDRHFALAAHLDTHLRAHARPPKTLKCLQCEKPFTSLYDLHAHQNKLNDVKPAQCPHCDKVLSRTTCIRYHRGKHVEGTQQYQCSQCGKQFSSGTKLKDHERVHGKKPYKCELCPAAFTRPSSLANHQIKHTGATPFKCCQCGQAFARKMRLKNHKRSHDDEVGGQLCRCEQCVKIFPPPTRLTSLEKRRHKCPHCGKAFERLTYLKFHIRTHTKKKGRPFRCDQCDATFWRSLQLQTHQKTCGQKLGRGPPGSYPCCQCKLIFNYKRPLLAHKKEAHPEAHPCHCPLCRDIFVPHKCGNCGQTFRCQSALLRHQRIHSGEKPFLCSLCGRSFTERTGLIHHEAVHSSGRPFRCPSCRRAFASTTELDEHQCNPKDLRDDVESAGRNLTGAYSEEQDVTQPKSRPHRCQECSKRFRYAALLRKHQRLHKGENVFRCPQCDRPFILLTELEMHLRTHTHSHTHTSSQTHTHSQTHTSSHTHLHTHKPFKCWQCEKPVTRLRDMWTHQNKRKDIKPTRCPHCDKVFRRTACLKHHRKKHPVAAQYVCSRCGKGFSGASPLQNHQSLHMAKPYKCPQCDAAFSHPSSLAAHQLAHGDEKPFKCCRCSSAFRHKTSLKHHIRTHGDDEAGGQLCRCAQCDKIFPPSTLYNKCPHCGKAFVHLSHLRLHLRTHARERPFRCGKCEKTFSFDSQLEVHKRSHLKVTRVPRKAVDAPQLKPLDPKVIRPRVRRIRYKGRYQCCRCDQTFGQKRLFRIHRKEWHADVEPCDCPQCLRIRPHECSECGKAFSVPSELRSHQKTHTNEKPYMCLHCGKSFAWLDSLRNHERTHNKVKQFGCLDCGKAFHAPADLRKHQKRMHAGETPHACETCGKKFAASTSLRTHMKVHSDNKPFVCSVCSMAFLWRRSLMRHELTHTGLKPYPCLRCGRAFTRSTGLATHRCSAERTDEVTEGASADT